MHYTGIGSRSTPEAIQKIMTELAYELGKSGWTLRSGCAPGADSAFEFGAWQSVQQVAAVAVAVIVRTAHAGASGM